MNTNTVNKKGKKRPFSEVALPTKLEKKENNESKKGQRKTKPPIALGNGNPTLGNKEQNLKGMDKQKKKSIKKMQQNNDESQMETQKSRKRKFEEISKKNPSNQKLQKEKPQKKEAPKIGKPPKRILTLEMIEERIKEMENRNVLTKTAKRKLAKLRKLCAVELEGKSNTLGTTEKKNRQNAGAPVKNKQKAKVNIKKEDPDDMDESDKDQSEQEIDDIKEQIKDENVEESNEDEEDEEMESEDEDEDEDEDEEDEEIEDEQDEEEEDQDDDDDDDDEEEEEEEEEDDDDEDAEDNEDVQASVPEVKKKGAMQSPDFQKKEDAKKK